MQPPTTARSRAATVTATVTVTVILACLMLLLVMLLSGALPALVDRGGPGSSLDAAALADPWVVAEITGTLTPSSYLPGVYANPATATPTPTATPSPTPTSTATGTPRPQPAADAPWQEQVEYVRGLAGLPNVVENALYSDGCFKHARYMVKTDDANHAESTGSPWYSPEGNTAAANSNLFVFGTEDYPTQSVIHTWMVGVFHGVSLIDPRWQTTGYGSYSEDIGTWKFGACLDVNRGRSGVPAGVTYPIAWPGNGATIPFLQYDGNEVPDPLTSCPGYTTPTGPPIYFLTGDGTTTPSVTAHSLQADGVALESCVFDETTYNHPTSAYRDVGRAILNQRDAVILIPKAPLQPGKDYSLSITVNGAVHTWTINTAAP